MKSLSQNYIVTYPCTFLSGYTKNPGAFLVGIRLLVTTSLVGMYVDYTTTIYFPLLVDTTGQTRIDMILQFM